jgi:hypothetical protein
MKRNILLIFITLLAAGTNEGQNPDLSAPAAAWSHNKSINLSFLQVREEMNYGLRFSGGGLSYAYYLRRDDNRSIINYEARIGLSVLGTHTLPAANLNIMPARISYLFKNILNGNISAGPLLMAEINYQFYPDLHSGNSFWFTHYSVGAAVQYNCRIAEHLLVLSLNTSLLGLTSRQSGEYDPYFWNLNYGELPDIFHSNLTPGTLNSYSCSEAELLWQPNTDSRTMLSYSINYMGYYKDPGFRSINHSVKLIIKSKKR